VTILNVMLGWIVDTLLSPFRDLPPIVGLAAMSLLTAAGMLMVVKMTSDQVRIANARRAMVAALFEIRLFNDDLPAVFRAQGEMLRQNAIYLRLSLVPMLWMMAPVVLIVAQLESHYGYTGLRSGQPVLVKATVSTQQAASGAELDAPEPIRVAPAVWLPAAKELIWQVTPQQQGAFLLNARINGRTFSKTLEVTDRVVRRSPTRTAPGFFAQLMYPSEQPLPEDAPITSISVRYPSRRMNFLGWNAPWIVTYFVLSLFFGLLLKRPFGVAI